MRHLLPALALFASIAAPLAAEDAKPTPPAQPPAAQPPGAPPAGGPGADRMAVMKEMRDLEQQIRPLREKVAQDPALIKAKADADAAQKAAKAKEEELLLAQPGYPELKAKRDELRQKMMATMAGQPGAPGAPERPMRHDHPEGQPAPAPAPAPK